MRWFYEVAERDHDIQNPTSRGKIVLLGEYLRLSRDSSVLDIACGKGGPALILASTYGCSVQGVEKHEAFAGEARARISAAGLNSLVEVRTADAAEVPLEPEAWDAALCLGAAFVWDRYESLHWRALEEWVAAHPDHADAEEIRSRHERSRRAYVRFQRALLGWAIFVGRKA